MDEDKELEELSQALSTERQIQGRLGLILVLAILMVTGASWLFARQREVIAVGLAFAGIAAAKLIHNQCFLYNRRLDPREIQERLAERHRRLGNRYQKKLRNARNIALVNGSLFVLTSPVLALIAVGQGLEESSILAGLLGLTLAGACLGAGIWMISWGRRDRS